MLFAFLDVILERFHGNDNICVTERASICAGELLHVGELELDDDNDDGGGGVAADLNGRISNILVQGASVTVAIL